MEIREPDGQLRPLQRSPLLCSLRGETVRNQAEILRHPGTGEERHRQASSAPVRDPKGRVVGAVAIVRDVTDETRVQAERERLLVEVQRQASQLRALLENLGEGVAIMDGEGHILLRNQTLQEMTGGADEGAANLDRYPLRMLRLDGSEIPPAEWPAAALLREGASFTGFEFIQQRPDGSRRRILSSGSAVKDENGKVALAIFVSRDVTEMRRLEQASQDFVHAISHDLRQPLTVIQGQAQMLKQPPAALRPGRAGRVEYGRSARRHQADGAHDLRHARRLAS